MEYKKENIDLGSEFDYIFAFLIDSTVFYNTSYSGGDSLVIIPGEQTL